MASKSQKLRGYPLPSVIEPEGTRQFCLTIPDDEAYYQAVVGQLTMLGKWWLWKHNADPTNPEAVFTSEVWRQVYLLEEGACGTMPIDCEEVESCLQTSPTINEIEETQANGYNPANGNTPINQGKNSAILNDDVYTPASACDEADKDALWSAINGLIDFWHKRNIQLLNEFTNAGSLQGVINTLLITQPIYNILSTSIKNSFASWLIGQAKSAYESQVTTTALYEIKCELFCLAVDNGCQIDLEEVINNFLSKGLTVSLNDTIVDFFTDLASFNGTSAEEWFAAIASLQGALAAIGEKSVSQVGLDSFINAAQVGALSPSGTWEAYCDDCASPSRSIIVFDFKGDYVQQTGEIVYRAPFNIVTKWTNNTGHESRLDIGKGLYMKSSNSVSRAILFSNSCSGTAITFSAYSTGEFTARSRGAVRNSTLLQMIPYGPPATEINQGLWSDTELGIAVNAFEAGNGQACYIEWIRINLAGGSPLPKLL